MIRLPLPPGTLPTLWGDDERYVSSYTPEISREEVGTVTEAGDGIARVEGLPSVMTNELLEFESGVRGLAYVGEPANLTVFDPDVEWEVVPARLASKSRNTPYVGMALRGRVMHTILAGRRVVVDGSAVH